MAGYRIARSALRPALDANSALVVVAPGLALVGGWLMAAGHGNLVLAFCVAAAGLAVAKLWPGPFIAVMVLVIMNGVPAVNLSRNLYGSFGMQDCAVLALAAHLYQWRGTSLSARHSRVARAAAVWSACLFTWWFITFVRSMLLDGISMKYAASYGRDFLYFAILLPFAVRCRLPAHSLRQGAWVLLAGVVVFAVGQTISSLSGHELSWLIHTTTSNETSGQLRLYSSMGTLVNSLLIFSVAWLASGVKRRHRALPVALTVLLLVSVALELTRSNYLALIVALVVGVAVNVIRGGSFTAVTVRIATAASTVAVVVIALNLANAGTSGIGTAANRVVARAESGITAVSHTSDTFGYRTKLDAKMLHILGSRWPVGLGFLDPNAHYVSGLPDGSIRNTDVGVFNALMTVGGIGAGFIYAPLLYGFSMLVRAAEMWRLHRPERRWIAYGGTAWIVWALVGSWNLVVLFSVPGLIVTALVLGGLAHAVTAVSDPVTTKEKPDVLTSQTPISPINS